jgi:hypothetical protein
MVSDVPVRRTFIFRPFMQHGTVQNRNIRSKEKYGPNRTRTIDCFLPFCREKGDPGFNPGQSSVLCFFTSNILCFSS